MQPRKHGSSEAYGERSDVATKATKASFAFKAHSAFFRPLRSTVPPGLTFTFVCGPVLSCGHNINNVSMKMPALYVDAAGDAP